VREEQRTGSRPKRENERENDGNRTGVREKDSIAHGFSGILLLAKYSSSSRSEEDSKYE